MPNLCSRFAIPAGIALSLCVAAAPAAARSCAVVPDPAAERGLLQLINDNRSKAGIAPLSASVTVRRPARSASVKMARGAAFAHRDIGWMRRHLGAQNLAVAFDAREAFGALMRSSAHRGNMVSRRWRSVGIGAARNCSGSRYFTLNFTRARLR